MSIFCTEFDFDEHKPILYQGSNMLPSKKDKRGGDLGFASIPPHITRNGKDNGCKPYPFLRFHLDG